MPNFRTMNARELSEAFKTLSECPKPFSGHLRQLAASLDQFQGYGEEFDGVANAFDVARIKFEYKVQRGHAGVPEWAEITHTAAVLAVTLGVISNVTPVTTRKPVSV
jgi:hypothetical protein